MRFWVLLVLLALAACKDRASERLDALEHRVDAITNRLDDLMSVQRENTRQLRTLTSCVHVPRTLDEVQRCVATFVGAHDR